MKAEEKEHTLDEPVELLSDEELLGAFTDDLYKKYMQEIKRYPVATKESNVRYYNDYCNGDLSARESLINTNLRLVVTIANRYKNYLGNLQPLDIISEGNLGLMKAIDAYNPLRGAFTTCAVVYINQAIKDAVHYKKDLVRKSVGLQAGISHYFKIVDKCKMENKPIPDENELCKLLGVTEQKLKKIIKGSRFSVVSINKTIKNNKDGEDEIEFGDLIEASQSNKPDEFIEQLAEYDTLVVLQEILLPREYFIVYYHILSQDRLKLQEIGRLFGTTRERVRAIEADAKKKMTPFFPSYSETFKNKLSKIRVDEGEMFSKIRVEPISINRIVEFMYVKGSLTLREQQYFRLRYLSKYNYGESEIVQIMDLKRDEYLLFIKNLNKKIKCLLNDVEKFRSFKKQIIETYKMRIFGVLQKDNSNSHVIDYPYLYNKYASCSYYEIYAKFSNVLFYLSKCEKKSLYDYFSLPRYNRVYQENVNNELMDDGDIVNVWIILDKLEQKKLELEGYGVYKKVKKA